MGEEAVIAAGVARGEGAEAAEQIGNGMGAGGEDGCDGQQDEAAIGRAGEGRLEGTEDVVDRLWESVVNPLDTAPNGAGLAGLFTAGDLKPCAKLLGGETLARRLGYTGHGSLLGCDVRVCLYPLLHQGGSPLRRSKNGKSQAKRLPSLPQS